MRKNNKIITLIAFFLITAGLLMLVGSFFPLLREEFRYEILKQSVTSNKSQIGKDDIQKPIDMNFGIVIPKINVNAKIIANVDPQNEKEYQQALSQGIAHAKGTSLPDGTGNVFLFSHSADDFFNAYRYNAVFYLLRKLKKGDEIQIYYKQKPYTYTVEKSEIVGSENITFINPKSPDERLTLMTCWPPGTTWKRLIVTARRNALDEVNSEKL